MSRSSWLLCFSAVGPACALLSVQSFAQTAPSTVAPPGSSPIEQVVVTAERRTTNIQKVPLAITAVQGSTLDKTFSNQISDLNATVPSLEITKASGFENLVTIRGVGSETPENSLTTSPGVSEYIDGVYIANSISLDQTLFDIDRIEVLRGPQGALYGTSSDGGAISIVTKQPELKAFGGTADVSAGTYNLFRERAEVNIPIGDTLAVRFSGQKYDHDGFGTDTVLHGNDLDDAHDQSLKAAILWKPIENFSATLTGMWYSADQNGAEQKNVLDPQTDPRKFEQDYSSEFNLHTQLYHLNLQYDTDWFSIKSVSAYQGLNHQQQEDSSRGAVQWLGTYDDVAGWNTKLKNLNEEFDLVSLPGSALDWVVGAFALNQSSHQFVAEFECTFPPCSVPTASDLAIRSNIETAPPSNMNYGNDTSIERRSYAAFAQGTLHLLPNLRFTFGARYNYDSYDQDSHNFSAFAIDTVHLGYVDHVPTFRADLDYDITPDNLLYGSISRGYKPGGTNGIYGQIVVPQTFQPETNTSFEIGLKNFFLDHSLRLNMSAFYYLYRNMQYIENDPVPFDGGMANIPSVHAWGFEAEGSYVALQDRLRINANVALENAEVSGNYFTIDSTVQGAIESQPYPSPCAYGGAYYNPKCWAAVIAAARNLNGKTPPAIPKVSGSASIAYTFDVPYGTLTPRAEFIFRGSEWERVFNEPMLDRINSYGVIDLNLLYIPTGTNWTVQLSATNVTNVAGIDSKYTDPYGTGQTSVEYIPPLQVIGQVGYRF
jgi:iron complex outermembrane receptor protein